MNEYDSMFDVLMSLRADMVYTNEEVQGYLLVLLVTVLISLVVLVTGILFCFTQIRVFINNASDLFLMGMIAIYVLICAAQSSEQFTSVSSVLTRYHHQQVAFNGWETDEIIQFLSSASKDAVGLCDCDEIWCIGFWVLVYIWKKILFLEIHKIFLWLFSCKQ